MREKRSMLQTLFVFTIAATLLTGCASSAKKPVGATARAEKGLSNEINSGGTMDGGTIDRPAGLGQQIPIGHIPGSEKYNLCQVIYFEYDKAEIKQEYAQCLDRLAAFLKDNPGITLIVEGHCDERGTNEYNLALGERRANSASDFLQERGISAARVVTRSWGEEKPIETCSDERCYKVNRRAEFYGAQQ